MKTELLYLTLVTALTGLLWVPYILDRIATRGLLDAVGYPANPKPQSPWAVRLMRAHDNAVENLVIFAPLVMILDSLNISSPTTEIACATYFWARLAHAILYTFGVKVLRSLAFTVGFGAQVVLVLAIFKVVQ